MGVVPDPDTPLTRSRPSFNRSLLADMVQNMVASMATEKVTISVDSGDRRRLEAQAAAVGMKVSPLIVKYALNWLNYKDAERLAVADQRAGLHTDEQAEHELALERLARAEDVADGHAA